MLHVTLVSGCLSFYVVFCFLWLLIVLYKSGVLCLFVYVFSFFSFVGGCNAINEILKTASGNFFEPRWIFIPHPLLQIETLHPAHSRLSSYHLIWRTGGSALPTPSPCRLLSRLAESGTSRLCLFSTRSATEDAAAAPSGGWRGSVGELVLRPTMWWRQWSSRVRSAPSYNHWERSEGKVRLGEEGEARRGDRAAGEDRATWGDLAGEVGLRAEKAEREQVWACPRDLQPLVRSRSSSRDMQAWQGCLWGWGLRGTLSSSSEGRCWGPTGRGRDPRPAESGWTGRLGDERGESNEGFWAGSGQQSGVFGGAESCEAHTHRLGRVTPECVRLWSVSTREVLPRLRAPELSETSWAPRQTNGSLLWRWAHMSP